MVPDRLHRFLLEEHGIRGELVQLGSAWREILARRAYPQAVRNILGEAMVASALLAATIKFRGRLSLQLESPGQLSLVLAQCTDALGQRGLARWQGEPGDRTLAELCPDGRLTLALEGPRGDRYQGMVSLDGRGLASALGHYFETSEQLPTWFWLSAAAGHAGGLLLQQLPGRQGADPDAWDRVVELAGTLSLGEFEALSGEELLLRLYHEERVRLFQGRPVFFRCGCSRERMVTMLRALGRSEVDSIVAEQGRVEVTCEFCGQRQHFDAVDAASLFAGAGAAQGPSTRH